MTCHTRYSTILLKDSQDWGLLYLRPGAILSGRKSNVKFEKIKREWEMGHLHEKRKKCASGPHGGKKTAALGGRGFLPLLSAALPWKGR